MTVLKRFLLFSFFLLGLLSVVAAAEDQLPYDQQLELIAYYNWVRGGLSSVPLEAASFLDIDASTLPLKCATPIVTSFVTSYNRLDKDLVQRSRLSLSPRPPGTNETFDSPAGLFKIHFTRSGTHAVYLPNATTGGIPNYVRDVARIVDSVYFHIIDTLGYPIPPSDGFYPTGVDSLYDVYITNLGGNYFGLTYPDSIQVDGIGTLRATSFMQIDNDYQELSFTTYRSRPLDAVRVTTAHEFFHAVHFGIDFTETENFGGGALERRYWFEMSATWMEEEIYDHINDYYTVLPFFYNEPRASIQQFKSLSDFHPYASCVFPIYLAEKYGRDIIKSIWIKCGSLGVGPSFLRATQIAIDSASKARCLVDPLDPVCDSTANFRSAFNEFALWNFFTGSRALCSPDGLGFSERENYPEIPESEFTIVNQYPASQLGNSNPKNPTPNSAAYFKLADTRAIDYTLDSNLGMFLSLGDGVDSSLPQGWGVNVIYQSDSASNVYYNEKLVISDDVASFFSILDPRQYRSVTFVLAPASFLWEPFTSTLWDARFGYIINNETLVDSLKGPVTNLSCVAIDSNAMSVPLGIFSAYPNPAVISEMGNRNLRFRFQVPTDSLSVPLYSRPYCVVDIYTVAGEYVNTCDTIADPELDPDPYVRTVRFELEWDMRSSGGKQVVSGIYLCVLRVFASENMSELLAEDKAKVVVIR